VIYVRRPPPRPPYPRPRFSYGKLFGLMAASMGLGMLLIIIIPSWSILLAALLIAVGFILYFFC